MLNLIEITGNIFDVLTVPAPKNVEIRLNKLVALYAGNYQVVGDSKTVQAAEDGTWSCFVLDTDGMESESYYIFRIGNQKFKKFVPADFPAAEFNNLPGAY